MSTLDAVEQLFSSELQTSKKLDFSSLHPDLATAAEQANQLHIEKYGTPLPVTSMARSRAEQQALFNQRGQPNVFMPLDPSKYPNQNIFHANAIDVGTNINPEFVSVMEGLGLHRPHGAKDPVHWELNPNYKKTIAPSEKGDSIEQLFSDALANAPAEQPASTAPVAPPAAPVVAAEPVAPTAPVQTAPDQVAPAVEPVAAVPAAPVVAAPVAPVAVPVASVEPTTPPAPRTFKDYVKETGKSVASFLDNTIGGIIPAAVGVVAHPLLKVVEATSLATGGKFNAAEATHAIVDPISRPFAKAVGIDPEDPAYKRESVNRLMTWVGEHVGEGSQVLSDKFYEQTGVRIPPSDFEYAANLGLAAVSGKVAPVAVKGVKNAIGALEEQFAAKKGAEQKTTSKTEPSIEPVDTNLTAREAIWEKLQPLHDEHTALQEVSKQFETGSSEWHKSMDAANAFFDEKIKPLHNKLDALENEPTTVVSEAPGIRVEYPVEKPKLTADQYSQLVEAEKAGATPEALQTMVEQFNAKKAAAEPVAPVGTVETQLGEQLTAKQSPIQVPVENPPMPTRAASAQDVAAKKDLLRSVGVETFRNSALEGNPKEASSQFITASADQGPYATGMTAQINHEKSALNNHFGKISEDAGGTNVRYGTPEEVSDQITSGAKIKSALEQGYKAHVAESKSLYKEAETAHGGKPVTVDKFSDFLKDNSNFAYENEKGLRNGINQYMSAKGLLDAEGNVKPMSIAQAEGVRQYINNKYHHETAKLGGQLKGLIDNEVFEQVGGETYQKARAHWKKGIETYDNPKAVGDLLSDRGVNQKIADESVTIKVAGLAESQFKHLIDTLRTDGQTAAINEIKTSLVDQIRRSGESGVNQPWNSIAAAKTASKISEKLKVAFADDPKGLAKIYDGIEAGNILHIPSRYPGAAVQTNLLKNKFSDIALQRGLGTAGASIGGFLGEGIGAAGGYAAGEYFGAKVVGAKKARRQIKQLESELTQKQKSRLSDMLGITSKNK